jgi:gluconolactonase
MNVASLLRQFPAVLASLLMSAHAVHASDLIEAGATPRKLAAEFKFTEGPASDAQGNVFFTDQPNDRILKWSIEGKLTTFQQPCGRANGLCFDRAGNLWACADDRNELRKIRPDGTHEVVLSKVRGKLLNGPNDLWMDPQGGIWFTDPYYKRDYWKRGPSEIAQQVYYLAPGGKVPTVVISDLKQPNGIIGSPDGKTLYVADIGAGKTYKYAIPTPGVISAKALFCEQGSDGMTIDERGNVYLTGKGASVYDPSGKKIEQIDIPEPWTANICFGGKERRTLFITASTSLYSLEMKVKGAGSQ